MGIKILEPAEHIEQRIYLIRGHKVMLSTDLARLYEVEPRALIQAIKRNIERFPINAECRIMPRSAPSEVPPARDI